MSEASYRGIKREFRLQFFAITGELVWHLGETFGTAGEAQAKGARVASSPGYRVVDDEETVVYEHRNPIYADQEPHGPAGEWR